MVVFLNLQIITLAWLDKVTVKKLYNNGHLLKRRLILKNTKKHQESEGYYNSQDYQNCVRYLDTLPDNELDNEFICRIAIYSNIYVGDFARARILIEKLTYHQKNNLHPNEYSMIGFVYSQLGLNETALEYYEKALRLNNENEYAIGNKGFTLILLDRFEEAITLFDKIIAVGNSLDYAYSNRGLAKIKLGYTESGLNDIEQSIKLNANNSYAYRNLGIYYADIGQFDTALTLFLKSKQLDGKTYQIDELILSVNNKI